MTVRPLCLALLAVLLCGCTGTMMTRTDSPMPGAARGSYSTFGGYPFKAVVVDYQLEERSNNGGDPHSAFLGLAVDIVVDLVLSPIDLVAWAFGCNKRGLAY